MTSLGRPQIHHVVDGDAADPPVLLVNGLGTTLEVWDRVVPGLSEEGRVVRYDLRGHGRTPATPGPYTIAELAADALAVLDAVGVERAHVVGTSLGGMVAQWLASNVPDRVARLVLICTAARLGEPDFWRQRADLALREGAAATSAAVVPRWFTPGFREQHPDQVARVVDMLAGCDMAGYAGCCLAIGAYDQREDLGTIAAPTLVIGGAEDPAISSALLAELAAGIPDADLEVVPGGAHLLAVEHPDTVRRLISTHLHAQKEGQP
ncbi:MAG: 3-oxoadipate enol-lactonase [Nocardioidaceae bacterium]